MAFIHGIREQSLKWQLLLEARKHSTKPSGRPLSLSHKASSRVLHQALENEGQDIVEGWSPPK
jgi:hypothetical protein